MRLRRTAADGIPSTKIRRLSFLRLSSASPERLDLDDFGWLRILLRECAAAAAAALSEGDMEGYVFGTACAAF